MSGRVETAAVLALVVLAFALGFERPLTQAGLGRGVALSSVEGLVLLAAGLWLAARALAGVHPRLPWRLAVSVAVWLAVLMASAVAAPSGHRVAVPFLTRLGAGLLIGWAAYDLTTTPARRRQVAYALALGGVGVAVLGLAEAAGFATILDWLTHSRGASHPVVDVRRISSTLAHPNMAAALLEVALPILLAWSLVSGSVGMRALLVAALLSTMVALALTYSRAGFIASLSALGVWVGVAAWSRRLPALAAGTVAGGCLVLFGLVGLLADPLVARRLISEVGPSAFGATYHAPDVVTARAGESTSVPVRVTNTSQALWPVPDFALGYHLLRADGAPLRYDGPHTAFPSTVEPATSVAVEATVVVPHRPGDYILEWDAVQEQVTWFSLRGTPPARTRLTVTGPSLRRSDALASSDALPPPGRRLLWETALRMAADRPLLGHGPDSFRWTYGFYVGMAQWSATHAHNLYLEWLVGSGIVGLMAFLWVAFELLRTPMRSVLKPVDSQSTTGRTQQEWPLLMALLAGLIAWFVHGLFDYFFQFSPTSIAFWIVAGLAASAGEGGTFPADRQ